MFSFFKRKPKPVYTYTPYEFFNYSYSVYAETKQVEDVRYSKGYGISDPLDVMTVESGRYFVLVHEVHVRRCIETNLPSYHHIRRYDLDHGPVYSRQEANEYIKNEKSCLESTNQIPKN